MMARHECYGATMASTPILAASTISCRAMLGVMFTAPAAVPTSTPQLLSHILRPHRSDEHSAHAESSQPSCTLKAFRGAATITATQQGHAALVPLVSAARQQRYIVVRLFVAWSSSGRESQSNLYLRFARASSSARF